VSYWSTRIAQSTKQKDKKYGNFGMLGNLGPYWVDIIDTTLEKPSFSWAPLKP
jgi:hypothetical protein